MGTGNRDSIAQFKLVCRLVKEFKEKNGRWPRPYTGDPEEHGLGLWCRHVKKTFVRGELCEERLQLVREIKFPLLFRSKEWNRKTDLLQEWLDHGELPASFSRSRVFANKLLSDYERLHQWKKEKLQSFNFKERYEQLLKKESDDWHQHFIFVLNHFKEYGSLPRHKAAASQWFLQQRRLAMKGKLCASHRRLFQEAGLPLFRPPRQSWEEGFKAFKNFVEVNERNPRNVTGERQLYLWRCKQKKDRFEGKLSSKRIQMLNAIKFDWRFRIAVSRNDNIFI